MTIALVAHTKVTPAGNSGGTSPSINTTGANLIVLAISMSQAPVGATVSDNKGNTYTQLNRYQTSNQKAQMYYCLGGTVGSGHTFTISDNADLETMCIAAFSGVKTSGAFDQQNGHANGATQLTVQTGSVTPTSDGSLIVSCLATAIVEGGGVVTCDSGLTVTDYQPLIPGQAYGSALAYFVQGSAAAINPILTVDVSQNTLAASIATFLPAPAAATTSNRNFPVYTNSRQSPITASIRQSPIQ